jgi:hypothetical protein
VKKLYLLSAGGITVVFVALGTLLNAGYLDIRNVYLNLILLPGAIAATLKGVSPGYWIILLFSEAGERHLA